MMIKQIISAATITLFAGTSYAWNFIYSHDQNGAVTGGSLQALRSAISHGSSVKVGIMLPEHEWQLPCSIVSLDNSPTLVTCVSSKDLATNITPGSALGTILPPAQSLHYTFNVLGQYTQVNIAKSNGSVVLTSQWRYPMRWYVN
jgi:hypothetical protein